MIAAFECIDDGRETDLLGIIVNPRGHCAESGCAQLHPSEWVVPMRIETGRDEKQIR